ncbi:MAG TPA: LamB/YcsF family protein [Pseudomonas xinjiangensis]|uniref:5-oxoprolinase subunit A n=2 Tax=root TaxID=1 RepID=A0A7V1BTG2_9GAMM|nr:LamB/YcsF family protein [Halopseudomonas xinjiangensis]HEC47238.1 LamB/YcsF family protein [Halopseudomonas xinjiangensis]
MKKPLLNCDMGESFGAWNMGLDEQVMPFVDCANIACGFHASDPVVMRRTVDLARQHDVRIGAHPSYPDLAGFGRRSMDCTLQEVENMLLYQIGALDGICAAEGVRVSYVKPHGALYNDMMRRPELLRAVMQAVSRYDPSLPLMLLARRDNSEALAIADEFGLSLMFEAFADRAYDPQGYLLGRAVPGAVHHDADLILTQALTLARAEPLTASDGSELRLHADTLCVHGDNPESVAVVRQIASALAELA